MVRRFDEVLSDKASKSAVSELQYNVDQQFVKKRFWDRLQSEIQETMEKQQATMKMMSDSVKTFEQNMSQEVDTAVKRGLQKYMVTYEKVLN
jgi:hypothetical protein